MKKFLVFFTAVFLGIVFIFASQPGPKTVNIKDLDLMGKPKDLQPQGHVKPDIDFGKIPLYFIFNKGQVNAKAKFYAKASRYTLWLTKQGLVFDSTRHTAPPGHPSQEGNERLPHSPHSPKIERDVSRLFFLNANKNPGIVPIDEAKLRVNYFIGSDKSKWHCDIPTSMAVLYKNLYKNIDLKVYGIEKQVEYDWIVKPGGDPGAISFRYQNVKGTRIDEEGNLLIETDFGELMHKRPISFQEKGNKKIEVRAEFKKIAENTYGFEVGEYDKNVELIIDPVVLAYSTYLGGGNADCGRSIAVDGSGNVYVTGWTLGTDFPTRNQFQGNQVSRDIFVTRLDTNQSGASSLIYSTYLGGGSEDWGYDIAVDGSGNAYLTGLTHSMDFPIRNQYQGNQGHTDVFVTRLDTNQSGASSLIYSTYLGGGSQDDGFGIAVDNSGNVYVTGWTFSMDFPTRNQFQGDQGYHDVFVTRLDTNQSGVSSLIYSTYLGGEMGDCGQGIAVDGIGNVYVAGETDSSNFPTRNQFQGDQGGRDVFVTKLDPTKSGASSLLYSTYLGGGYEDRGFDIAIDGSGNAYVTGYTRSTNFPTHNQYQGDQSDVDAFVTKLDPTRSGVNSLLYSTYLGGSSLDYGIGIAVDGNGNTYVTGDTYSTNFPTRNQFQGDQGGIDAFVTKLDPTRSGANSLLYSTYLGGASDDRCYGIAVDDSSNAYVAGDTHSTDFPILNQYQGDQGGTDVFVTRLSFGAPPTVDMPTSTNITYTTAALGGSVSSTNGANVTERGVYWSTTDGFTPPGQGTKVSETGNWGTGSFTVNVTGLPPGTIIYFQVFAINSAGIGYSAQASFTTPAVTVPTVTTTAVSNITSSTASSGGNVTSNGGSAVTARGVCWSTSANPTTADSHTTDGTGTGTFSSSITGLSPGITYHVRAYATNSVGTSYGSDLTFTTAAVVPTVSTTAVSNVTSTSADSGGNVTSDGGAAVTARGVCWNTSANPTTADNHTTDGTGTGTFTSSITGLSPGTTYHVRAYATNNVGTSYGSDLTFTTAAVVPTVSTTAVSNITSTSANSGGNVTDDGGSPVTARGVCWSTSANPTTVDSHTTDGTGTGTFTSSITGLSPGTTYHIRAYATNNVGTSYGSDLTFTTAAVVPTVTTTAVSNVTSTSASSGGNVTGDGGSPVTARGVCWSTSANPTTAHNKTTNSKGLGTFTSKLTGLRENTTYYVRAYAINSAGTAYGNKVSFSSPAESVSVTITEPQAGALVSGTVTIKATATSNHADAADASIMTVKKVEFYIDSVKIAQDNSKPYQAAWDTTNYEDGTHTIAALAYNTADQTSRDEITVQVVNTPAEPPEIMLNRSHLDYGSVPQADAGYSILDSTTLTTGTQRILINNIGGGTLNWTISKDADWLSCTPEAGTGPGAVSVSVDTTGLPTGTYNAAITIQDPQASNSPQTIPVTLKVYNPNTTNPPFGYFETPIEGSTVMSSIPVTGWALDDIDITSVKIYRAHIPGHENAGLVYIGDGIMVDGARPDVEQQFAGYPRNYQAGWGYMLLTNFLPHQGNGTFTLYAKITDKEGYEVTLGSKTIVCDNASAVKPFGAIDTPEQGGTASGSAYINFGWVLTPRPQTIPFDGSTITVWVDGVPLGHPVYNRYREDIAELFPGYNNSSGASGYFCIDTDNYLNGVHTIAWSAKDDAGHQDGIGSRYFTILNIGSSSTARISTRDNHLNRTQYPSVSLLQQALLSPDPVYVKKGYARNTSAQVLYPDSAGIISISLREDQRVEILLRDSQLPDAVVFGYMITGDRYQLLPIGSTLDMTDGIFYWQPCAGFFGQYRFVFIEKTIEGQVTKKLVNVVIHPRY